ncbi:MAG TPA: FAD-binding protein [Ignavibacteria bacterium]|nr:FAD-binding protein [Ignavibacteria bacterium]HMR39101.1 FAD-binding protein [Ignavibacteria bacterium]
MIKRIEISILPEDAFDKKILEKFLISECNINEEDKLEFNILRRSIDARSRTPLVNLLVEIFINETPPPEPAVRANYKSVSKDKKVIIVGAGPAGYFAALELIEHGIKPIVLDRGKDVRSRRKDLRAIQQFSEVNPDSNYCFGEGGAGTYSDGKLYTRSHKRGDIFKALRILVEHGASEDILIDTHPHIGSNKLPGVVEKLRETILNFGGEIYFDSLVTDFILKNDGISGVIVNDNVEHIGDSVILATGHSARDIFYLLKRKNILTESKPFALGVRIEHPQALIDEIQYRQNPRSKFLPASSYKLTAQVNGKGVFSFCMCPGGLIVPAATAPGEIVVNGMSMSRRDSEFANSGIVTAIDPEDLKGYEKHGSFAGLEFQKNVERKFFDNGDGSQKAPAQRMTDFAENKISYVPGKTSYIPGIYSADLHMLLPKDISARIRNALIQFGKKMRGYYSEEGFLVGLESRTSSPVRIPRDKISYEHPEIKNFYPCGEGAGYAGGIISAALDGQNVAKAIAGKLV